MDATHEAPLCLRVAVQKKYCLSVSNSLPTQSVALKMR